jgi:alpha-L-fucosidase
MFLHFGMATFTGRASENDPLNAKEPSTRYAPTNLDVDQWMRVARDAGMNYAVLTAKHSAGHCLWDSKVQFHGKEFDYDVATSGNPTDVVAEFVKACKKYGILPGLYWCLQDNRNNSKPPTEQRKPPLPDDFFQLAKDQLAELIARYPEVGYYWIDIPAAASPAQRRAFYDLIKRLRPGTVVMHNHGAAKPRGPMSIANSQTAWPTDVLNTEIWPLQPGWFTPQQTWQGKDYLLGYEHCDNIGTKWFWFEGDHPRPVEELAALHKKVRMIGGNLLLNVPPDRTGRIPESSVKALMKLKERLNGVAKADRFLRPGMTVEEVRRENGWSDLRLMDAQGVVQSTVSVNLGGNHQPATRADDPRMEKWHAWKYGAFLCYNSSQFSGSEHCTSRNPLDYAPSDLNVRQWAQTLKAAGMNYAVLTTSHTSGFLLWDSPTTQFDVANSGDSTDVVQAFVEECQRHDVTPALYYCMWGGPGYPSQRRAEKRTDSPRAVILYQFHELATRYGPIPYFWIDMMHGGWAPADLSAQEIYNLLRTINPDTVVTLNQGIQDGSRLLAFPTDAANGELLLPPPAGHNAARELGGTTYHIPFEFAPCSQALAGNPKFLPAGTPNNTWFTFGEGKGFEATCPIAPAYLYTQITEAWRRGASNVLLACAPDHTGRFRAKDVAQLTHLGGMLQNLSTPLTRRQSASASSVWQNQEQWQARHAVDGDPLTRWSAGEGARTAWLEVDLGTPQTCDRAIILEAYPKRDRIRSFRLEREQDGAWVAFHHGGRIGEGLEVSFPAVTARRVRLHLTEATDSPTILEFQLSRYPDPFVDSLPKKSSTSNPSIPMTPSP